MPFGIRSAVLLGSLTLFSLLSSCSAPIAHLIQDPVVESRWIEVGVKLRLAIDKRYSDITEAARRDESYRFSDSLTDVVERFLPAGCKVGEARTALAAAGFVVSGPQQRTRSSPIEWVAIINPYEQSLFSRTSVSVSLEPSDLTFDATVKHVEAGIGHSYL